MVEWAGWMLRWAGWAKGQSPPGGAEAERSEGAVDRQDRRRAEEERREGAACTVGRVSLEEPTSPDHPEVPKALVHGSELRTDPWSPGPGSSSATRTPSLCLDPVPLLASQFH